MKPNNERCPCGGIILADTEDMRTPLCADCYWEYREQKISALEKENEILREAVEFYKHEARVVIEGYTCDDDILDVEDKIYLKTFSKKAREALKKIKDMKNDSN